MIISLSKIALQHFANQAAQVYSLIRKRCACGKVTTARQLRQYGRCITCVRGAS